jgi:outer membrane autotransporter protein
MTPSGHLGVWGQWTMLDANGAMWQPYGRFNVWQDWGGAADTLYSGAGVGVPVLDYLTRLEFAGGRIYSLQPYLSFYTQFGYEWTISPNNVQREAVRGDIGLRYTW